ncbi:hypothetical protein HPP92_006529 [Vanilla planifolia]|uniref:EID1-like F-box protein 3 n=1 Tax=Vanilla planifolia TaxID=51239 RepID=A0A835REJ6_VANPL|nr:hypothetical protein HPP92_006527 [Vanilla planifolia]KAG0489666.1 hypothetical protein HPP92_006529 [Vanilla planifolia]
MEAPTSTTAENRDCFKRTTAIDSNTGIMDERVLLLVFTQLNFDPHVLSVAARVSRRLRAVVSRVLWRHACISRAPRLVSALTAGFPSGANRVCGGWHALAKLLFYCAGCEPSSRFPLPHRVPGHFVGVSRFSKTSGRSFLSRQFWGDLLYVSDPCEHAVEGRPNGEDLGAYRGVFCSFVRSLTRAFLVRRRVDLEMRIRCPYCGTRVWNMTAARLVPRSASRRLGAHHGRLEYFVCVNGHLYGNCWLEHLSSSEEVEEEEEEEEEDEYESGSM